MYRSAATVAKVELVSEKSVVMTLTANSIIIRAFTIFEVVNTGNRLLGVRGSVMFRPRVSTTSNIFRSRKSRPVGIKVKLQA